jgi:hypothetical protein
VDDNSSEQTEEERVAAFARRAIEFANEINKLAFVMGKNSGFTSGECSAGMELATRFFCDAMKIPRTLVNDSADELGPKLSFRVIKMEGQA